jgi:hypothetical protein
VITIRPPENGRVCIELPEDMLDQTMEMLKDLMTKDKRPRALGEPLVRPLPLCSEDKPPAQQEAPAVPKDAKPTEKTENKERLVEAFMQENLLLELRGHTGMYTCNACGSVPMNWDGMNTHCSSEYHQRALAGIRGLST